MFFEGSESNRKRDDKMHFKKQVKIMHSDEHYRIDSWDHICGREDDLALILRL